MSKRHESFEDVLVKAPWWASVSLGVAAFVVLRWIWPAMAEGSALWKPFAIGFRQLAPYAALLFGFFACMSAYAAFRRRGLVDKQTSLETLKATPWKDFEFLVAEAYRRQGFAVEYSLGGGADGGVDLVLKKGTRIALVQCKQWKTWSVGAPVVRELFGVMTAEHADETIIVTTGKFTREAQAFAAGKPIDLVDGNQLLELVKSVQVAGYAQERPALISPKAPPAKLIQASLAPGAPTCPTCSGVMVLRTARRGDRSGGQFWGCPKYPVCRGTRPYAALLWTDRT